MSKEKDPIQSYKRLLIFMKPYRLQFLWAGLLTLAVSATAGGAALIMKQVLDDVFLRKDKTMLVWVTLGIIGIYLVRGVSRYLSSVIMKNIGYSVVNDIRNRLYAHIQTLSLSFFQKQTTGNLTSRILNDLHQVQATVQVVGYDIIKESLTVIVLMGVLLYRDPLLTLITVIIIPFPAALIARLSRRMRGHVHAIQERMASITSLMHETFSGYRVVQAFGMQKYEAERFERENREYLGTTRRIVRVYEISSPLLEFVGALALALIIFYGGMQVINGVTTVGGFFSFLTALFMLFAPMSRLSQVYNLLQQAGVSATRIFEVLDLSAEIGDAPDAQPLPRLKERITIEDVSFRYDAQPVLENISLDVKAGSIVAIVGMSGAGKSTLVDLIPRFYDPVEGRILIDGRDIKTATLESLRAQMAVVTQDVFLFNDTVRNNIAYGRADVPMERIIEKAKAAYAHEFIMKLPNGYDTVIGERGTRLSGGQRQRLSIARALLKDPAILILDEATSALDTESELAVQKALNNLMEGRTTFVIAHRLSTVRHADTIIVLDNGRIVESGAHDALIGKGGVYGKVHALQFNVENNIAP